jgi:hypothetical protein
MGGQIQITVWVHTSGATPTLTITYGSGTLPVAGMFTTVTVLPLFASAECDSSNNGAANDGGATEASLGEAGADGQSDTPNATEVGDAVSDVRTLVHNPLFGDEHPQSLFIDPNFSVRSPGLGDWQSQTGDPAQTAPSLVSSLRRSADAAATVEESEAGAGEVHRRVSGHSGARWGARACYLYCHAPSILVHDV